MLTPCVGYRYNASLVPVLATSFDDLQRRVEAQTQQATGHQEKLKEIRARIEKLSERHVLANAPRLQKLGTGQAQLSHRLLRLVQHLHLLIPALRSSSIRPEEEALRAALEEIDGEIRRPGGMGRIVGKLNELWALVGAVNAMRGANSKGSTDGVEWAVVDDEGLNQIVQVCQRPDPATLMTNHSASDPRGRAGRPDPSNQDTATKPEGHWGHIRGGGDRGGTGTGVAQDGGWDAAISR